MRHIDNKTSGFSLMEMLISIVIGMIIVAAASTMLVNILKSQKDIASSAQLNQELGVVMAVMSNEIRRAGFSVCDIDDPNFECPVNVDGEEVPFLTYALGEGLKIGDGGKCIEYRYNADLINDSSILGEQRSFRFNNSTNTIQMGDTTQNVVCADIATPTKWKDLTDPNVIKVTALSFSTIGSMCRNMSKDFYWVVGDDVELACADGTMLDGDCVDLNDPVVAGLCDTSPTNVKPDWVNDTAETLFGVNQIKITMQAELTRDSAVSKNLQTSVKVENPWIRRGLD